ncbi:hypothetical protein SmJEL517_g01695 [Synchytrium microbalum]|uniref:DUF2439 domain-containing protein n=1 Tax=Synchytrium microbalum TaxID=1806994 RepID=A0A507CCU6_9FUNG|nr:uncharacterized protein SmJEL517_g01695 [Synchytrium microbalum]TPX35866.1 hypothetical protein SmJEL517_g01695 [Synchytrium microbalum]
MYKDKKRKTWNDGIITVDSSRAVLYDDRKIKLDSLFVNASISFESGAEVQFDRFLVEVEKALSADGKPVEPPVVTAHAPIIRKVLAGRPRTTPRVSPDANQPSSARADREDLQPPPLAPAPTASPFVVAAVTVDQPCQPSPPTLPIPLARRHPGLSRLAPVSASNPVSTSNTDFQNVKTSTGQEALVDGPPPAKKTKTMAEIMAEFSRPPLVDTVVETPVPVTRSEAPVVQGRESTLVRPVPPASIIGYLVDDPMDDLDAILDFGSTPARVSPKRNLGMMEQSVGVNNNPVEPHINGLKLTATEALMKLKEKMIDSRLRVLQPTITNQQKPVPRVDTKQYDTRDNIARPSNPPVVRTFGFGLDLPSDIKQQVIESPLNAALRDLKNNLPPAAPLIEAGLDDKLMDWNFDLEVFGLDLDNVVEGAANQVDGQQQPPPRILELQGVGTSKDFYQAVLHPINDNYSNSDDYVDGGSDMLEMPELEFEMNEFDQEVDLAQGLPEIGVVVPGEVVSSPVIVTPMIPPNSRFLRFPTAEECQKMGQRRLLRVSDIPTRFANKDQYRTAFVNAITECLQIQISNIAVAFRKAVASHRGDDLVKSVEKSGTPIYARCSLERRSLPSFAGGQGGRPANEAHFVLGTIWVVSNSIDFIKDETFFAKTFFYGLSNMSLDLVPYSPEDLRIASTIASVSSGERALYAIRLCEASSEDIMIQNLESKARGRLIPYLLDGKQTTTASTKGPLTRAGSSTNGFVSPAMNSSLIINREMPKFLKIRDDVGKEYKLNADQTAVLNAFAASVSGGSHVTLVHGVFGSGKSFLLMVLIIFLKRVADAGLTTKEMTSKEKFRVAFASMTNVAVDRVLLGLLKLGFRDFVRVGSLKRISKKLLPFAGQVKPSQEEIKELVSRHDEGGDGDDNDGEGDDRDVKKAIARFKSDKGREAINSAFLMGITCIATSFEAVKDKEFDIVILDESSQIPEPLSLCPIKQFNCSKAILVGDPKQLPPTLNSESAISTGLGRTMFERLADIGMKPIRLRVQYRCHPRISSIANELFYGNTLINGCTEEDLTPLIEGLPTLAFVDVENGNEEHQRGGTYCNPKECDVAVRLVNALLKRRIPAAEIGVICLYKGQADSIDTALRGGSRKSPVQVSTVDAFQGAEKSVIILSTVRTENIGFIDETRRVNVALTRAKRHLFVLGNAGLLSRSRLWSRVINDHCKKYDSGVVVPMELLDLVQAGVSNDDDIASLCHGAFEEKAARKKKPSVKRTPAQIDLFGPGTQMSQLTPPSDENNVTITTAGEGSGWP